MEDFGSVHHIELYVSDLKTASTFWQWLLVRNFHYRVYQKWTQGISFKQGDGLYLVLVQTAADRLKPPYNRTHVGLNHLAFSVPHEQDVARIRQSALKRGYHELYADRYPNAGGEFATFYFEGPDRLKIEITAEGR